MISVKSAHACVSLGDWQPLTASFQTWDICVPTDSLERATALLTSPPSTRNTRFGNL